jgi:mRNA interferase MazF
MNKDYWKWHHLKSQIEQGHLAVPFNEREIWWCSLGANIGTEQDGKHRRFERPVLVIKKFNKEIFWGLPVTSQQKSGKYYISFTIGDTMNCAILSQLRLFSSKRLVRKMVRIADKKFDEIVIAVARLLTENIGPNKTSGPLSGASGA